MALKALRKQTTEDPELADRFDRVLGQTVEAMDESGLRYVFIGGIASGGLGRPRSTHDIDIFVKPEDAELALRALAKKNFRTERTDPTWLYKAFKEDILVDVIFKSKGEIYLDQEMYSRSITAPFHNRQLRLVAPEDLLIIKAVAHSELTPGHWHDATALLSHAQLDWPYLILRAAVRLAAFSVCCSTLSQTIFGCRITSFMSFMRLFSANVNGSLLRERRRPR